MDEGNFWWPCRSYRTCQLKQQRAVLSFCHLRYQQGWCWTCLVWTEADDVAVTQGEFNASVAQCFNFISESQKGWGRGEGRVKGGGIRRLIFELVINTLTLGLWCFVLVVQRLLCVRVHHLRPEWRNGCCTLNQKRSIKGCCSRSAFVEAICPEKMLIEVINDPFQTSGFVKSCFESSAEPVDPSVHCWQGSTDYKQSRRNLL